MKSELAEQILALQPGDHLCLIYDRDPAEQLPALIPFIQNGLSRNEQFVYVADDQTLDELAARLEQSGIKVGPESDRGALKLWTRQEWCQPGEFSSTKMFLQVSQVIEEACRSGFKGIRFAVEMTWTLGPDISAERLEHWEASVNTILVPQFPGRIVCQYNRSRLDPKVTLAALYTHPLIIAGDHIHFNLFYEAPLILDGNVRGNLSATKVEWIISQLKRARAAEQEREAWLKQRTAMVQAELNRKKVEDILSLMPVAVCGCDAEGKITFFNRHAAELWGREPRLAEDKFCGSLQTFRPDGTQLPLSEGPMAMAVKTGKPIRNQEIIIKCQDGSKMVVRVNVEPLYDADGARSGAINLFHDISELRQAEQALRKSKEDLARANEDLDRRVRERTAHPERAKTALLEYLKERKRLDEEPLQTQNMESIGTRFRVYLPGCEGESAISETAQGELPDLKAANYSETVLLTEGEEKAGYLTGSKKASSR